MSLKAAIAFDKENTPLVRFGKMEYAEVYDISGDKILRESRIDIPDKSLFVNEDKESGGCHGKNDAFLNALSKALSGISFLIVGECGSYPSRVLLRSDIQVLEQQGEIEEILSKLQTYVRKNTHEKNRA